MLLHLSDLSPEPLHLQISRQIRAKILSGDLAEDAALPSIRVLAREQHVSVITVQRAYEDLEREGLLNSRRGKGFFVATLSDSKKESMAVERLKGNIGPILADALAGGLTPDRVARVIQEKLKAIGGKR